MRTLLLFVLLAQALTLIGVSKQEPAAGSNCLLIEGGTDKILLEDLSGCIAKEGP